MKNYCDIYLYKQEQNVGQCLQQNESSFEYYNIENALCGKTFPQQFEMKQFVVIELLTQREKIDDMGNEEKMKLGLSNEQIKQFGDKSKEKPTDNYCFISHWKYVFMWYKTIINNYFIEIHNETLRMQFLIKWKFTKR